MCGKIHEDCQNTDYAGFSKKKTWISENWPCRIWKKFAKSFELCIVVNIIYALIYFSKFLF